MCDLSHGERETVLGKVDGLEELIGQIRSSAASVVERSWIDHETMDRLLGQLASRATEAQGWVQHKAETTHQHS